MSKKEIISTLSINLIRKLISNTLSKEEQNEVDLFLVNNPEYKELFAGMNLADLQKLERVNNAAEHVIQKRENTGYTRLFFGIAGVMLILLIGSVWYQFSNLEQGFDDQNNLATDTNLLEQDVAFSQENDKTIILKETVVDTFYYLNKDEKEPHLKIESIEPSKPKLAFVEESKSKQLATDSIQKITSDKKEVILQQPKKVKEFIAVLDYRQSLAVESDYANAYKVGQTKSFAGEIGGYEFDPSGMPHFGESDQALYDYVVAELKMDTLLNSIHKFMEAKVSFEVSAKGHVENVNVVKCNHKQLCMKLTEIFESFPTWYPAENKGKKGSVHYVIQVSYE